MPTAVEELAAIRAENAQLRKAADARRKVGVHAGGDAPAIRTGQNPMSSRQFSFSKLLGYKAGIIREDEIKTELDLCSRLMKANEKLGWRRHTADSVFVPIWPEAFGEDTINQETYYEVKSMIGMDPRTIDDDEMRWHQQKAAASPAQSWIQSTYGGTFVPPATFGPPIELLRNKEALMAAGASTVPLGPSGRLIMPRLTQATQGGWSGENIQQTPTVARTGSLNLSAKKVIGIVVFPGELIRFGSPATEMLVRNDLFKTVALIMDKGLLEGVGSDNVPLGLATMGAAAGNPYGLGIVTPTNANQLAGEDVYQFPSTIEENNAEMTGWIMRPKMAYTFYQARWTPYSGGTSQGGFLFELIRTMDGKTQSFLAGMPVTKSANVSNTRGNGSQTYILGGNWPDYLIGMFGAIEFLSTDAGYTLLSSDQVAIRAVLECDGGPQHPGAFSFADSLNFVVAG